MTRVKRQINAAFNVFDAISAVNLSKEPRVARFEGEFGRQFCERDAPSPHWHVLKAIFYVNFASSARVAHFVSKSEEKNRSHFGSRR